jgi:hypothetical protein
LLAYELYLKNKEREDVVSVKTVAPIKKIFVEVNDAVSVYLDSKTLESYGERLNSKHPNFYFQDRLVMPSNNLVHVGLPYRGTGAASSMPYVEFYGFYKKNKLSLSLNGKYKGQKVKYEYIYDIQTNKETLKVPVDLLVLRLDKKNYAVGDKVLFDIYQEARVITSESALSSKVFTAVCKEFSAFWKEKIALEDLKEFNSFSFRIVVLPLSLLMHGEIKYQTNEDACVDESFEDCFGNSATGYPSKATINAKFFSFDDEAFTINCKTGKNFYENLGIGNESFDNINLPSDKMIKIAGLEWYFFDLSDSPLVFDVKASGIYDQLLSNYVSLSNRSGQSVQICSTLKVLCIKRAQAKLEILIDENLTLEQLKGMFSRAPDNLSSHHLVLETLIVETDKDILWADYITAIRYFMNGIYFDRAFLVQRFTCILRSYLWSWLLVDKKIKKNSRDFFDRSQFCLNLLTKNKSDLIMNKNEEYAYKIGIIAGKYVKFKRNNDEANNSTKDILTYSKYDRERLRFVYQRVSLGVSLSKVNTDNLSQAIKNDLPKEEIEDAQSHEDYSYFFYKGVFENLN